MPIDYSKYPVDWKTRIRPEILERDGYRCKICGAKNYSFVFRGIYDGCEVYQTSDGSVYHYPTGEFWLQDVYAMIESIDGDINAKAIKIILTIAHLDHDTKNNDYDNLAALCQKCHLNHDKEHHRKNGNETRQKKKGLVDIFNQQK